MSEGNYTPKLLCIFYKYRYFEGRSICKDFGIHVTCFPYEVRNMIYHFQNIYTYIKKYIGQYVRISMTQIRSPLQHREREDGGIHDSMSCFDDIVYVIYYIYVYIGVYLCTICYFK
jgi:hypothetical protein